MTLLWTTDPSAPDRYRLALGGGEMLQLTSGARVLRALDENRSHEVVVIGPEIDLAEACTLAEQQRIGNPELGVVLLRRRVDVATLNEALRSGVREVVDAGDTTALAGAVRRSRELTAQLRGSSADGTGGGRVITVFSAKGGVGKTTLATNLAAYLASTGARTLLVDLDVMFGDVAISLQLNPTATLADAVTMAGHLDPAALESLTMRHEASGLDVMAAPSDPAQSEGIPGALVTELLRVARAHWTYVVVDTPPNISEHVLSAFDVTDLAVLIATLDIPAVKNLRIAINTLDTLGGDQHDRVVVLNRATDKVGLSQAEVETALKTPVTHALPSSSDVAAATNKGVPLVLESPRHPVSVAVHAIADEEVRQRYGEPVRSRQQRRRLFGRSS